ncbi:MAG: BlaI/MecI/CopY family transcriptional regulator [Bacteroidales bacterium]|nr:BlaI/MecI/CopY family transcriptional regulator [Bacteroidales bacterium]
MKTLTKAEEQIMQCMWQVKKGFLKDFIDRLPDPKPAYTTVATIINTLIRKNFISYKQYGKLREYYPKVTRNAYFAGQVKGIVRNFFNNSYSQFASTFTDDNLSLTELEELRQLFDEQIEKQKKDK